jgi:hypothetical protein
MSQASQLTPELARGVLQVARALVVALQRLASAIRESSLGAVFSVGVAADTLLIEGAPTGASQAAISEAALLHDRGLVWITFLGDGQNDALCAWLRVLTLDLGLDPLTCL